MLPISPRLMADAMVYLTRANPQTIALEEFGGYRRGGPRVHRQSVHVSHDAEQVASMLYPDHDYELRRSEGGQEAQAPQ